MATLSIKTRPVGATAKVGATGHPMVTSLTGGEIEIVTGASAPGLNPLDLMCSSLAACLVLSGRIAASKLGLLKDLTAIEVAVSLEKTPVEPYRVTRFFCELSIDGKFSAAQKLEIAHGAEEICTVSNTLKRATDVSLVVI